MVCAGTGPFACPANGGTEERGENIERKKYISSHAPHSTPTAPSFFFSFLSLSFSPPPFFFFFLFSLCLSPREREPHRRIATTTTTIPPLTHSRYSQVSQYSDNKLHTAARDISPILTRKIELIDARRVDATLFISALHRPYFSACAETVPPLSIPDLSFLAKEKKRERERERETKSSVHLSFLLLLLLLLLLLSLSTKRGNFPNRPNAYIIPSN